MTDSRKSDDTKERTIEVLPLALFALVTLELTALVGQHVERGAASFFEVPASPIARLVGLPVRSLGLPGAYLLMGALLTLVIVWWVNKGVDHAERRAIGLPLLLLSLAGLASLMEGQSVIWGGRFGESLRVFFLMVLPHGLAIVLALALFAFALILARDWFFFDRLKDWIQRSTGEAFALGVPGAGGVQVAPEKKPDTARPAAQRSELSGLDLRPYDDEVRPVTPMNRIEAPQQTDTTEEKVAGITEDMARDDVKVEESITAEVPIELQDFEAGLDAEDRELEELAHALNLPATEEEPFQLAAEEEVEASDSETAPPPPAPVYGSAFGPPTWADDDEPLEEEEEEEVESEADLEDSIEAEYEEAEYEEDEFEDDFEDEDGASERVALATEDIVEEPEEDFEEDLLEDTEEDASEDLETVWAQIEDEDEEETPDSEEDPWRLEEDDETEKDEEEQETPTAVQSHLFEDEEEVDVPDEETPLMAEPPVEPESEEAAPAPSRPDELDWAPWDETPRWSSVPPTPLEGRGAPASGPGAIPVYDQAVELCLERDACSVSLLQRELGLDFRTSASLIERMEADGLVGPYRGTGRREILGSLEEWRRRPAP
ncbi:MAG TPA: hypothetical protein ENK43_06330 [Planctomycetes bacterium]|nr:hypothetical protein [Planctomycetota bacterium]